MFSKQTISAPEWSNATLSINVTTGVSPGKHPRHSSCLQYAIATACVRCFHEPLVGQPTDRNPAIKFPDGWFHTFQGYIPEYGTGHSSVGHNRFQKSSVLTRSSRGQSHCQSQRSLIGLFYDHGFRLISTSVLKYALISPSRSDFRYRRSVFHPFAIPHEWLL